MFGTDAGIPRAAVEGDECRSGIGFDIIDDGRLLEITLGHRERRPVARGTALAFERFDEGRFLAADIGARPKVDFNVEITAGNTDDVVAQQIVTTPAFEYGVERFEQMPVFAAQIKKTAARPDRVGSDGHAFKNQIGMRGEQDTILEGTRLAFVGIADDKALLARFERCVAAGFPLQAGGKPGAAATTQVGMLDFVEYGRRPAQPAGQTFAPGTGVRGEQPVARHARMGGTQGIARLHRGAKQDVGTTNIVLDAEQFGRPFGKIHLIAYQFGDLVDAFRGQPGNCPVIDEQRRPLIAHASTGGRGDADQPVFGNLAGLDPQVLAQALDKRLVALHAIGNVVGKKNPVFAARLGIEKGIKPRHAFDLGARHAQRDFQRADRFRGKPVQRFLDLAQYLHHVSGVAPVAGDHAVDHGCYRFGLHIVQCHNNLPSITKTGRA